MSVLSRESLAQILYQVGFRGDDLVAMVAIAGRESGYRTEAHRTDTDPGKVSGDRGLFQINYVNDNFLRQRGIISSPSDLFDPLVNARADKALFDQNGLAPWTMGSNGWQAGGDPYRGTNMEAARSAVNSASAQGLLGQNWQGGSSTQGTGPTPGQSTTDTGPAVSLPPDAKVYVTNGFSPYGNSYVFAVFDVGGVRIAYNLMAGESNWKDFQPTYVNQSQWDQLGVVMGGDVQELSTLSETFDSYGDFFSSLLDRVVGPYNPARDDPGVLRVLAEFAARPDMDPAELTSLLERTSWYREHTQAQLEWNGLSDAEKELRINEAASRAADVWWQLTGERIDPDDSSIRHYATQIASGALGWGGYQSIVQDYAKDNPESPYSRETRTEEENQRQRPIDIENTAANIRQLLNRWGVQWSDRYILEWARQIVEKTSSDDDLLQSIKLQAANLYAWKDPEMETLQAAQPWIQKYQEIMEAPGSLTTRDIQSALTSGQTVWDFEQSLKKKPEWAGTRNGQSSITSMAAEVGRRMGFVA